MLDRNYLKSIIVINSSSFDFESKFVLFDTRLTISLLFNYWYSFVTSVNDLQVIGSMIAINVNIW